MPQSALNVSIDTEGISTAGETYLLSCTVTTVQGLVNSPDIVWIGINGTELTGESIRLEMNGNSSTATLELDPLFTSSAGQYTCHAFVNTIVQMSPINASASITVVIQSE